METRVAQEKDIQFLVKVCKDVSTLYDPFIPGAFEGLARKYEMEGLPDTYKIKILSDDGMDIGYYSSIHLDGEVLCLVALYVLSLHHGKGYGGALLSRLEAEAKANGIKKVALFVHNKAEWARRFYLRKGFEVIGDTLESAESFHESMGEYYLPNTSCMCKRIN